jgi:hypothetical protein
MVALVWRMAVISTVCVDGCATGISPRSFPTEWPHLKQGGVQAGLVTTASLETTEVAIGAINLWHRTARRAPNDVCVVTSVPELRTAVAQGKFAAVIHFQGTVPLGTDLELVDAFHRLGLRVMQLTYNYGGLVGDGGLEERDAGLTVFGRQVVQRMQEVGVAVDLAHAGRRTCRESAGGTTSPTSPPNWNAEASPPTKSPESSARTSSEPSTQPGQPNRPDRATPTAADADGSRTTRTRSLPSAYAPYSFREPAQGASTR